MGMSKPNCLGKPSNLFDVCCLMDECEGLKQKVEAEVGDAVASVSAVAKVFGELGTVSTPAQGQLPTNLMNLLEQIAEVNDGSIPLHGRLFQQWLHHAFPLECPFPHVQGVKDQLSEEEWELLK